MNDKVVSTVKLCDIPTCSSNVILNGATCNLDAVKGAAEILSNAGAAITIDNNAETYRSTCLSTDSGKDHAASTSDLSGKSVGVKIEVKGVHFGR